MAGNAAAGPRPRPWPWPRPCSRSALLPAPCNTPPERPRRSPARQRRNNAIPCCPPPPPPSPLHPLPAGCPHLTPAAAPGASGGVPVTPDARYEVIIGNRAAPSPSSLAPLPARDAPAAPTRVQASASPPRADVASPPPTRSWQPVCCIPHIERVWWDTSAASEAIQWRCFASKWGECHGRGRRGGSGFDGCFDDHEAIRTARSATRRMPWKRVRVSPTEGRCDATRRRCAGLVACARGGLSAARRSDWRECLWVSLRRHTARVVQRCGRCLTTSRLTTTWSHSPHPRRRRSRLDATRVVACSRSNLSTSSLGRRGRSGRGTCGPCRREPVKT
jgi:hypothetical protein